MTKKDKPGTKRKLKVEITPLIKKIEALTKRLVRSMTLGEYMSIFRGAGFEFDGYKAYTPDMDASTIDWKASIRSKSTLVKIYREIKDLQVYFMLDISGSMLFGSTDKLKIEYALEFMLAIIYTIISAGDAVGLITFSDNVIHRFRAAKGNRQFYKFVKILLDPTIYGGGYNLANAEEFALNFIPRKNSLVIIISDFYGLNSTQWKRKLQLMTAKFDTVCIVIRDPRDRVLPEGVGNVMVEDPYTGERLLIDSDLLRKRYEAFTKKQDKELFKDLTDAGVDIVEVGTDKPLFASLVNFFVKRKGTI